MKHHLSVFAFLLCLSFSTILVADISDNLDFIEAIKKYYEIVDKAKLAYENELRKVLANTQKAGNLSAYNAIEAELNHTIGKNGHSVTPFEPPKNSSMYIKKSALKRAVDSARIGFKKYADNLASELLKAGKVEDARDVATISKAIEPPRFYIEAKIEIKKPVADIGEIPGNFQDTAIRSFDAPLTNIFTPGWEDTVTMATPVQRFRKKQAGCYFVNWSPDETKIATSGEDHFAAVWDVKTGGLISELKRTYHSRGNGATFTKDGNSVIFGGWRGGEIGRWDYMKNSITWKLASSSIHQITISPDGKTFCSCETKGVFLWNSQTGRQLFSFIGHSSNPFNGAFFAGGQRLVTVAEDKTAIVWDVQTGNEIMKLKGHNETLRGVAVSPDNRFIATGSNDNTVAIWNASDGKPVVKIGTFSNDILSLAFSPDNTMLAVGGNWDANVIIVDTNNWKPIFYIPMNGDWNCQMAWSSDSRRLLIGGSEAQIWRVPLKSEISQLERERKAKIAKAKELYLIEMKPESWKVSDKILWNSGTYKSNRMEFDNSLWAHAPSNHTYRLERKWKKFKTSYGIRQGANLSQANVTFIIKGDGKELFRSEAIRDSLDRSLELDIRNVDKLELIIEPNGSNRNDYSIWFSPLLLR